jgi:hypothetical protein
MRSLSDAWNRADHWSIRQQILAIVAGDLERNVIEEYFPGVSKSQIKRARRHAHSTGEISRSYRSLTQFRLGRGAPVDLSRAPMQRFSPHQVEHFIEFILSPMVSTDLPFGERF